MPCVRIEGLSEKEIKTLRLADNQIASMAEWDMGLVIEELKNLDIEMFELTGFSRTDFDGKILSEDIDELSKEREIDLGKYKVITVEAPEAPRLKARVSFYFEDIAEFERVKKYFDEKKGRLDTKKLLGVII